MEGVPIRYLNRAGLQPSLSFAIGFLGFTLGWDGARRWHFRSIAPSLRLAGTASPHLLARLCGSFRPMWHGHSCLRASSRADRSAPTHSIAATSGTLALPSRGCTVSLCRGGGRGGSVQAWDRRQGAGDLRAAGAPRLQRERARCKRLPVQTRTGRTEKPERWSPPSPAVPFTNHAPHQYTAETAGSKRIRSERKAKTRIARSPPFTLFAIQLGCFANGLLPPAARQSVGTKCGDEAYPTRRGTKCGRSVSDKAWRQGGDKV